MGDQPTQYLSPRQAGEKLGLKRDAVVARCRSGAIPGAVKDEQSGHIRIPAEGVRRYKEANWTPLAPRQRRVSQKVREHFPEFADRSIG